MTTITKPQLKSLNNYVGGVFVLTVQTFHDRIAHIKEQLDRQGIQFEFIFKHDANQMESATIERCFAPSDLKDQHKSLVLKHIETWYLAVARGLDRILVFEDDVILADNFVPKLIQAIEATTNLEPGYLIFLSGGNTKVPFNYFLSNQILFPHPIATAEGYVTDITAIQRRLVWLENHKITLPADHLIRHIDEAVGNRQFWLRHPIVSQGSVTGIFDSVLDEHRQKHNKVFNLLRYYWTRFKRRIFMEWLAKIYHLFSKQK